MRNAQTSLSLEPLLKGMSSCRGSKNASSGHGWTDRTGQSFMARLGYAWVVVIVTSLLLGRLATSRLDAGAGEWGPFESEGTVLSLQAEQGVIELDHEAIQGPGFLMAPMQMVFTVADPALLNGLSLGDRIRFTVSQERTSRIIALRKLTK